MSTSPYVWYGEYWCEAYDRGAWRNAESPLDREDAEIEIKMKSSEQDRTMAALQDYGFKRNEFGFLHATGWIGRGKGWWRNDGIKGEWFTDQEAVARLNELVAKENGDANTNP